MNTREKAEQIVREMEPASIASVELSKNCTNTEIVYCREALIRRLGRMTEIISRGIESAILEDRVNQRIGVTHRRAFVCNHCGGVYADEQPEDCDCMEGTGFHVGEIAYRKTP